MGKIISFMHISLDGFVAGPKGEMDWIHIDEQIFDHVATRIGATDTAIYGRKTYEMMEGYWPTAASQPNATKHDIEHAKWYESATKIVLSSTMKNSTSTRTKVICDHLEDEIAKLKQGTDKEILIFGSPTATHSLMATGLIDGYWLFVNPVILGQGIPLFNSVGQKTAFTLDECHVFSSGVVCLHYIR